MQACPPSGASTSLDPPETYHQVNTSDWGAQHFTSEPSEIFRHTGWWRHRYKVYQAFHRTDQSMERRWNFSECGKHSYVVQSPDDPDQYRVTGSTCHDRFCLPCANSRSHTIALNTIEHLANREARFITLTLRSTTEPLVDLLRKITTSFVKLRTRALWKKTQFGGVAFIEVKWVPTLDRWNVHLHILSQGKYIRVGALTKLWKQITRTSIIVDVRFAGDATRVSRYITKYASKPLDPSVLHDEDRLDEAIIAFKGKRLCTTYGSWRGVKLTDSPSESAWETVDTLYNIINAALRGETESIRILNLIGMPSCIVIPEARPPPTSRKTDHMQPIGGQQLHLQGEGEVQQLQWM